MAKGESTEVVAEALGPHKKPFRIQVEPLRTSTKTGRPEGAVVRFIDITSEKAAEQIEIHWPSGIHQTLKDIRGDQILQVQEPAARAAGKDLSR